MKYSYLLVILIFLFKTSGAQDASYWQNGYGAVGSVVPGSRIVSDNDSGAYYFNPALNAIHSKTSVTISGSLYQWNIIGAKNAVGTGETLKKGNARIIPMMASGTVLLDRGRNITVGYALITRQFINFNATLRDDRQKNALSDLYSPGTEYFVGSYNYLNTRAQTTASGSIAFKPSEYISLGVTGEGIISTQTMAEIASSRVLQNVEDSIAITIPVVNVESNYSIDYWHAGMRFKAGFSFDKHRHHIGVLLTTPLIGLMGRAVLSSDILISNYRFDSSLPPYDFLANGRQKKLHVKYRLPLSLAVGYAYDFERGQISFTGEYFMNVKSYELISPRNTSFVRPDTGMNNTLTKEALRLSEVRNSVTNFGVALTYRVQRSITAFASVATNFSYYPNDPAANLFSGQDPAFITWNTYNLQAGASFRRQRMMVRAGILTTYGRTKAFEQPVNFGSASDQNLLQGDIMDTRAYFLNLGVLLSYVHNF